MQVKVYLLEVKSGNGEEVDCSMCFLTKEFGLLEYTRLGGSTMHYENFKELKEDFPKKIKGFEKYALLTYLGKL